jgi:isopenicillin N synthase-like dioxygenase
VSGATTGAAARPAFEHIPVIDVGALRGDDAAARRDAARQIGRACEKVGFLYVRNHGVTEAAIDALLASTRQLFALPLATKMAYYIGRSTNHRGYVPVGEEVLAYGRGLDQSTTDSKEGFDLALDLPGDDPDYRAGNPMLGPNVWPAEIPTLRVAVTDYYDALLALGRRLMRAMALALDLEEGFFDRLIGKPVSQLRLLHYPGGAPDGDAGLGIGAHTDYECFTILLPTAPGLQVMNSAGRWIDAPPLPGAFVINIGDMLEAWTNGRFVATSHRVLRTAHERYAFPLFFAVDYDTVVSPLPSCVPPGTAPRYPAIRAGQHLFAQTARTFRYLREKVERGELAIVERIEFGRL